MNADFKYITVLDYENGKVNVHQFDGGDAETYVSDRYHMDNVYYMVHKSAPSLFVDNLYYCNREEVYRLYNEEDEY